MMEILKNYDQRDSDLVERLNTLKSEFSQAVTDFSEELNEKDLLINQLQNNIDEKSL